MALKPEIKNTRLEILKQEEKVISEMNNNSELTKRLKDAKDKHNQRYSINDEIQEENPRKIALPENDSSI